MEAVAVGLIIKALDSAFDGAFSEAGKVAGKSAFNKLRELFGSEPQYAKVNQLLAHIEKSGDHSVLEQVRAELESMSSTDDRLVELARQIDNSVYIDATKVDARSQVLSFGDVAGDLHVHVGQLPSESQSGEAEDLKLIQGGLDCCFDQLDDYEIGRHSAIVLRVDNHREQSREVVLKMISNDADCHYSKQETLLIGGRKRVFIPFDLPSTEDSVLTMKGSPRAYEFHCIVTEAERPKWSETARVFVPRITRWQLQSKVLSLPFNKGRVYRTSFEIVNTGNTDIEASAIVTSLVGQPSRQTGAPTQTKPLELNIPWRTAHDLEVVTASHIQSFSERYSGAYLLVALASLENGGPKPVDAVVPIRANPHFRRLSAVGMVAIVIALISAYVKGGSNPEATPSPTADVAAASQCPYPEQFGLRLNHSASSITNLPANQAQAVLLFLATDPARTIQSVIAICRSADGSAYYFARQANNSSYGALTNAEIYGDGYVARASATAHDAYLITNDLFAEGVGVGVISSNGSEERWPLVCTDRRISNSAVRAPEGVRSCELSATPVDW